MPTKKSNSVVRIQNPLDTQIGGDHYKSMPIQTAVFNHRNGLGWLEGNVIKYVCRWKSKAGIEDLNKAKHYLEMLIELETNDNQH